MKCKVKDFMYINPAEKLSKGTFAKKVPMDKLQPFCRDIPEYEIAEFNGGTKFRNGDTIMARITPCLENGKTALVNILDENEVGFGSTEYIVFRAKEGVTDANFVYYLICSPTVRDTAIKSMVGSSGRQRVQTDVIANIEVNLPTISEQRRIADILSSLDDKIELNERINKNLEQQAQALFKSWFVDFEPFGGVMPEGWRITTFGDVCNNLRERTMSNDYTVFSAVNTGELQPSTEYFTKQIFSKDISNYLKVPQKAFAYNPARVNIGSIGLNTFDYDGCVSPVYVVFTVEDNYEAYFNYIIKTPSFKEEVKTRASGSVRQSLNYRDLALIELAYPDKHTAKRFNDFFWFIHSVKRKISEESNILIELRDTLLPKLMSGELDVSNLDI